jgi:hypothetical protein
MLTTSLLLALGAGSEGTGQYACMFGNPRCGLCMDDPDCGGSEMPTFCEFSTWFQEAFDAGDSESCAAYVKGGSQMDQDVTKDDIADPQGGVPALAYGITYTIFPDSTGIMKLTPEERKLRLSNSTINASDIPCTSEVLLKGIKGADYQDCLNKFLLDKGEEALEDAACEYFSGGAATPFCDSPLFKGITSVVNKVANHFIEEPIVHAMDKVEDAAADCVKSVAGVFASWFRG